jgi:hypothetical protein
VQLAQDGREQQQQRGKSTQLQAQLMVDVPYQYYAMAWHGLETIGGQREVATRRWHGRVATSYYLATI